MADELRPQLQIEGKQALQIVVGCLLLREQDWEGETQLSISHCFVPGQNTDCGELIAVTKIRTDESELSGICRSCCSVFTVSFSELTTD